MQGDDQWKVPPAWRCKYRPANAGRPRKDRSGPKSALGADSCGARLIAGGLNGMGALPNVRF
jgi:hypothetical protein